MRGRRGLTLAALALAALALTLGAAGCSTKHPTVPEDAIVFIGKPKGDTEEAIMIASPDGKMLSTITSTSAGRYSLEWSPNGAHLSFVWGYSGPYIMNPNGSGAISLEKKYKADSQFEALWSPDGKYVAFARDGRDFATLDVAVLDVAKKKLSVIARNAKQPSWSPDGQWLSFYRCEPERSGVKPQCAIAIVNKDGTGERTLVDTIDSRGKSWSPDGSFIAFFDHPDPSDDSSRVIRVVATAGSSSSKPAVTTITDPLKESPSDFDWSPTGNQLVVAAIHYRSSDEKSSGDVLLTDVDGSNRRVVSEATWSDVNYVSWTSEHRVEFSIDLPKTEDQVSATSQGWELDVENLTAVQDPPREHCQESASPDGTRIVFVEPCGSPPGAIWTSAPDGTSRVKIADNGSFPIWRPSALNVSSK
jgi:Tol biopolymer transport system component